MVYLVYPANIPNLPGHSWENAVAMATPLAHKGSLAGAKVQAMTALDYLLQPGRVKEAWAYFTDVQTKDLKYAPLIGRGRHARRGDEQGADGAVPPRARKRYYDPRSTARYLEQLGIKYPTVRE